MFFSLAVLPVLMLGQNGTVKLSYDSAVAGDTVSFRDDRCNATQTVNYDAQLAIAPCTSLKFWVTDASDCQNEPSTSNLDWVFEVSQSDFASSLRQTGTFNVPLNDLPYFKRLAADGGMGCGVVDEKRHRICGAIQLPTSFPAVCTTNNSVLKAGPILYLDYDTKPPDPPTLGVDEAQGADSKVSVTVSFPSDDVKKVQIQMAVAVDGGSLDFQDQGEVLVKAGSKNIENLQNGTTYAFRAFAYDAAGNKSVASNVVEGTPIVTNGFWKACVEAGCPNQACSLAGAGPFLLAAMALLTALRRQRR